eukprot:GHVU01026730.1.p2 GENE.GHVU01026730.1~~GHVU01026730.1.p2  ORF type:complete len:106 (-),score=4.97 GHVU01026730.1:428-745(-)
MGTRTGGCSSVEAPTIASGKRVSSFIGVDSLKSKAGGPQSSSSSCTLNNWTPPSTPHANSIQAGDQPLTSIISGYRSHAAGQRAIGSSATGPTSPQAGCTGCLTR